MACGVFGEGLLGLIKSLSFIIDTKWLKYLNDPDNHDGVLTHLQPDILECEVKWALGSITANKASGGDGIPWAISRPVEVLHFKVMLLKCCTQYASKFGKFSSDHRTGIGQFSFQSQRKARPKNV